MQTSQGGGDSVRVAVAMRDFGVEAERRGECGKQCSGTLQVRLMARRENWNAEKGWCLGSSSRERKERKRGDALGKGWVSGRKESEVGRLITNLKKAQGEKFVEWV